MAELINEIVGQKAFEEVALLDKQLGNLVDKFENNTRAALLLEAALSKGTSIKEFKENVDKLNKANEELERDLKKVQAANERLTFAQSEYGKQVAATSVEIQKQNTANKNAAREMQAAEGSINQMSATLIKMRMQYDAMSKTMRESPLGKELVKKIQDSDAALKALDATTGRFQRNVGDYKNQLFGLTQVFRELPGFTYSAQTGILGLSNNLTILLDNFKSVAAATNEATGKVNGTMGALKIFGASIFSFSNVFAIAIGLFTIFSKEIFAFFDKTKKAVEVTDELTLSIAKESAKMTTLKGTIEDVNAPMAIRLQAIETLKKEYPGYFDGLTNEALLAGQAADQYDRLARSMEKKARANIAQKEIEKIVGKIMQAEKELASSMTSVGGTTASGMPLAPTTPGAMSVENMQRQARETKEKELALLRSQLQEYIKISIANTEITQTTEKRIKAMSGGSGGGKTSKDGKTYNHKGWGDVMKNLDMFANDGSQIGAQAELMRQKMQEYLANNPIEVKFKWTWKDSFDAFMEQLKSVMENANELTQQSTQMMSDISDALFAAEMSKIDTREKRMNDFYNAETKRINSSFTNQTDRERELAKLTAQKEAQQKRIDRDRISAERKRAQQQKAYDVANIVTSTALAVIKAYTEGDPYTKVARSILAGAAGAASLARAIAAPIPQYAKGTDNHPGGLAVVGEKGIEMGILPSGKPFLTPGTDTLMDLPAQTKIIPHEQLMDGLYGLAFKKLANVSKVGTSEFADALINVFEAKLEELITETKRNKTTTNVSIVGNFDHYMHIKKNIR